MTGLYDAVKAHRGKGSSLTGFEVQKQETLALSAMGALATALRPDLDLLPRVVEVFDAQGLRVLANVIHHAGDHATAEAIAEAADMKEDA